MKILSIFCALTLMCQANPIRVFIGTGGDGIHVAELDEKEEKFSEPKKLVDEQGNGFLSVSEDGQYLFAATQLEEGKGGVISYEIQGRELKELSRQEYPGKGLCHVSLDATEQVLFGADYGGGSVVTFPVENGKVQSFAGFEKHEGSSVHPKRQQRPFAHSFYAGPNNKYAYAVNLGTDSVEIYSFDPATAKIVHEGKAKVPPGSGARHMRFGKDGNYAYVLNELTLTISVFLRDANSGMLEEVQVISVLPKGKESSGMSCSEIQISKDGRFVYCASRDWKGDKRDAVSVLEIDANGKLSLLQNHPAKIWIPRHINLTPSGEYLLIAGQKSNEVIAHKVDLKTGLLGDALEPISVQGPMCIDFP